MPVREWVSTTVVPASKATVMYMFLLLLSFRKRKAIPEMKGRRAHKKNASPAGLSNVPAIPIRHVVGYLNRNMRA